MTAETFVTAAATRHSVFVQRFAGGEALKAQRRLIGLRDGIIDRLTDDPTQFRADRLTVILEDVDTLIGRTMTDIQLDLFATVDEFAVVEAEFTGELLQKTARPQILLPSDALLIQAVKASGMDTPVGPGQITIQQALDAFAGKRSTEILTAIQDGMLVGDTLAQTVGAVVEAVPVTTPVDATVARLRELNIKHRRQVEALTRTVVNHTANQATKQVIIENAELLEGEKWVATLDSRTTLICAGRDGRIYPPGLGPYPPAHWNCRSRRVPVIKDEFSKSGITGRRGAIGGKLDKDGDLIETRGQVRGDKNFGSFLADQPAAFQDEYLGPTRGKLFRQGGLTVDRFRDETGVTYTLDQLRDLNPLAFDAAGV